MVFVCIGALLALYLGYCLVFYKVDALITPYHIHYELYFPKEHTSLVGVIYFMTTIIAPFISTQKKMPVLGAFNFLSFIITEIFFDDYMISVWCFFSALIRWQVFLIIKNINQPNTGKLETAL